jgi:serine/threonine protein kinase
MVDEKDDMVAYCPECGTEYDGHFNACPEDGTKLYHYRAAEKDNDPLIGIEIDGRFRIERVLGEGGMGKVYRAVQLSVDRPVALKVLHRAVGKNKEFIQRFLREARVISGFKHPNIVTLVDFGQDPHHDLLYLVMEMLDGGDLAGLLERGRLRVALAVEIALQVCAALSEPHANGVVHRDLKPENLMLVVTSDGSLQVKVLDFGIAQAVGGDTKLTKTGMVYGTPKYMAPEQAKGAEMTGRTDIYALGIILFQMLVGQAPFDGDTAMQIALAQVQSPAPQVRDLLGPEDVPESLVHLVGDMLRKAPDQRPSSVLEVRDRLEAVQNELENARVRLDVDQAFDERFSPWILEPVTAAAVRSASTGMRAPVPEATSSSSEPVDEVRAVAPTEAAEVVVEERPAEQDVHTMAADPVPANQAQGKSKGKLVLALLVLVLAAGGVAAWLLSSEYELAYEYAGPGSENAEYVWPWSDEADLSVPVGEGDGPAEDKPKKAATAK